MCELDVHSVKPAGKKYKKKLYPNIIDAGMLAWLAYLLWLVSDFTQAEACAIVGARFGRPPPLLLFVLDKFRWEATAQPVSAPRYSAHPRQ